MTSQPHAPRLGAFSALWRQCISTQAAPCGASETCKHTLKCKICRVHFQVQIIAFPLTRQCQRKNIVMLKLVRARLNIILFN